jgi:hypothetical protein
VYVKLGLPLHPPGLQVRVWPALGVPVIAGGAVFCGGEGGGGDPPKSMVACIGMTWPLSDVLTIVCEEPSPAKGAVK